MDNRPTRWASRKCPELPTSRSILIFVGIAWLLTACATRYQPVGFTGGHSEVQVDANTYKVSFRGNGYTSRDGVETYLMYRCAELTVETGYDYFVIVWGSTDARHGLVTTPGTYTSSTTGSAMAYGNTAYGSSATTGIYTPGQTLIITKHDGTATIKVFKGAKPLDNPNAFVAKEVLQYLSPHIQRE